MAKTPKTIIEHSHKYRQKAWEQYTPEQLAHWAINLTIRACHRKGNQLEKISKDIEDGRNYLDMLAAWMDEMNDKATSEQDSGRS